MYIQFVDFEKAFDSINILWAIMKKYGIPKKLINMVKALYKDFQCSVIKDNEITAPFSCDHWALTRLLHVRFLVSPDY